MGMSKSWKAVPVALSVDEIARHPRVHAAIRQQSQQLLQAYDSNPRLSSVFGTQHRWLMGQAALALSFRAAASGQGRGVNGAKILDFITEHAVASRNTANAFLQEMVYYGWARVVPDAADRRTRPIEPSEASVAGIHGWLRIHLATLDRLDDGQRLQTYPGAPDALDIVQTVIADGLLS